MGNYLSIDSYWPIRPLIFPAPHPLRSWSWDKFEHDPSGRVPCYVVHRGTTQPHRPVLIHSHGNGTDVEAKSVRLSALAQEWQVTIVSWEYPGYGPRAATETCSAHRMRQDVVALYNYIKREWKVPDREIFSYGHSLGSGPAVYLTATMPLMGGLILQSPYTSIRDVAASKVHWALASLCPAVFDNASEIAHVVTPILFIHGQCDNVIPFTHSQQLAVLAHRSPSKRVHLCPQSTHNEWDMQGDVVEPVREFLTFCLH